MVGVEPIVHQLFLHVVPAHVRHEQADVDVACGRGLLHVEKPRGRIAHLVELQHGERRRLLLAAVGIVIAVSECGRRQHRRDEPPVKSSSWNSPDS